MRPLLLAPLLAALAACATPSAGPATYANPVLDADFPDPALVEAPDGWIYAYATQTERDGKSVNLQVARSRDLVSWQWLGDALPVKPAWASRTQDFWAPHVARHGGTWYLYYSAKPDAALEDESRGLCLAVARASRPEGPFTDIGAPLECGPGFENIDPFTWDDPETGKRLFYWGSGFGPIKVRELAADRISFAPGSEAVELIQSDKSASPREYHRLVEGPWLIARDGWHYLFYSGDNCCGPNAHYAVMVARSRSPTGPFEMRPDPVVLKLSGKWIAPGHNSVFRDDAGEDWIVYHAVDAANPRLKAGADVNTRRIMLIDRIVWEEGWPRIAGPSEGPRPAPVLRH